jgi:hypothetical protein
MFYLASKYREFASDFFYSEFAKLQYLRDCLDDSAVLTTS